MENNRINWIVSLRTFACLSVVMLHTITGWTEYFYVGGGQQLSARWILDVLLVTSFARFAVPSFLMISGSLLLDPKLDRNIDKIKGYIKKMLFTLLVFGFPFCFIEECVISKGSTFAQIITASFKNLIEGHSWSHMWYVYMIIGVYFLTPMLRSFIKSADNRTIKFTLTAMLFLTIIIPSLNNLTGMKITRFEFPGTCYLFYYILGYYLKNENIFPKYRYSLLLISFLGIVGINLLSHFGNGYSPVDFPYNTQFFVFLFSVLIFLSFKNSDFLSQLGNNRIVSTISKYSFGIYILHPFFLNLLNKGLGIFPDILPPVIGELVFFLIAFSGALITTVLISKIKIIRKFIL